MKVDRKEHIDRNLKIHDLLKDFKVEDVWLLPINLDRQHSLTDVLEQLIITKNKISEKGLVGKLFNLRLYIGKVFHWDNKKASSKKYSIGELGERYAKAEHLNLEDLPQSKIGNFAPVYYLDNESLLELENNIVQAAIHLVKIQKSDNNYIVNMAVYVKPKGRLGYLYMLAIKPFRLLIVYPTLMKELKIQWENFIESKNKNYSKLNSIENKNK